ncbi:uncharacterized protein [Patagioenas fasciata]|uniref:uncharacterized protein isoform X3 n=1 Tax=Patagioenas fasciata TaxID=372321 RepID=UPI003A998362
MGGRNNREGREPVRTVGDLDVSMDTWNFFYTSLVSLWLHRLYVDSVVAVGEAWNDLTTLEVIRKFLQLLQGRRSIPCIIGISIWIIVQFLTTKTRKKGEKSNGNPASSEGIEDKLVNGSATLEAK